MHWLTRCTNRCCLIGQLRETSFCNIRVQTFRRKTFWERIDLAVVIKGCRYLRQKLYWTMDTFSFNTTDIQWSATPDGWLVQHLEKPHPHYRILQLLEAATSVPKERDSMMRNLNTLVKGSEWMMEGEERGQTKFGVMIRESQQNDPW